MTVRELKNILNNMASDDMEVYVSADYKNVFPLKNTAFVVNQNNNKTVIILTGDKK